MGLLPEEPIFLVRTVVVGVAAYLGLIAIVRVSGKRTLSQLNAFDFIVTVALGSTLATILLSNDVSLVQGLAAVALLIALQFVITWTSRKIDRVARLVKSEPTALVYRGRLLRDALERERVLEVEVDAAVRASGYSSTEDVDLVVLETNGSLSVIGELGEGRSALTRVNGIPDSG